jgi:hypothetical protein
MTRLIALTPVKNEDWILEKFLKITCLFVDCIIVADQNSEDQSRHICSKFPKVHVIENKGSYSERERQLLLIETARQLFPGDKRILLCLDADEIISADSLNYLKTWAKIQELKPGCTIFFEKPDLLPGLKECRRWQDNYFPVGYVDDGKIHQASIIHSTRIPVSVLGENEYVNDIKILHFAHSRKSAQLAKQRYYSVIENVNSTNPVYLRRRFYRSLYDPGNIKIPKEEIPIDWLKEWDNLSIDLRNLPDVKYSWHDFEVLSYFKEYGCKKFYLDEIWDFDWEECRKTALKEGRNAPLTPIVKPGPLISHAVTLLDRAYSLYKSVS